MRRKIYLGGALILAVTVLAGCGNAIPEMSKEQQEQVVEYAAGIVRRYDANHPVKLKSLEETKQAVQQRIEAQKALDELMAQQAGKESTLEPDSEVAVADTPQTIEATLESMLKTEGFSITYKDYVIKDFYPDTADGMYFMMTPTSGNQLLVVRFTAQNNSDADAVLDIISTGSRFWIQVNGETKNALTTMLLNDMANFQGTIPGGQSEELVVVCEIPKEQADSIESLALTIKNGDGTATVSLNK